MKQINFAYSNFRTACGLWISRNAYPVWTTNSVTHCSAPWRPTRDLCWDTAWRRGTYRLESTLGCNIQANSSGWMWPRPTSIQRSYHPTFLSYLLHSYTLSLLTKASLLPLVLPHLTKSSYMLPNTQNLLQVARVKFNLCPSDDTLQYSARSADI